MLHPRFHRIDEVTRGDIRVTDGPNGPRLENEATGTFQQVSLESFNIRDLLVFGPRDRPRRNSLCLRQLHDAHGLRVDSG